MLGLQDRVTYGIVPVPAADSRVFVVDPLLANVSVPDDFPPFIGVNVMLNGTLWPAAMVIGNETPAITNCELLMLADDTVTFPPVEVRAED